MAVSWRTHNPHTRLVAISHSRQSLPITKRWRISFNNTLPTITIWVSVMSCSRSIWAFSSLFFVEKERGISDLFSVWKNQLIIILESSNLSYSSERMLWNIVASLCLHCGKSGDVAVAKLMCRLIHVWELSNKLWMKKFLHTSSH